MRMGNLWDIAEVELLSFEIQTGHEFIFEWKNPWIISDNHMVCVIYARPVMVILKNAVSLACLQ